MKVFVNKLYNTDEPSFLDNSKVSFTLLEKSL